MVVAAQLRHWTSRRVAVDRSSDRAFLAVCALLFAVTATVTVVWCGPMSAMGMPMPGGWTMSMAWMRMQGQTWPGAAASFLGMWMVMMVAMMLPSLVPMLRRYRESISGAGKPQEGRLTALVGAGYFFTWTVIGIVVFPLGSAIADLEMQHAALARAVPMATAVTVLMAAAIQFTAWKARHLARCGQRADRLRADGATAWRHGIRLGLDCGRSCGNLMAVLLVTGVMDLGMMALVAAAITLERLEPAGQRAAQGIGVVVAAAGLIAIGHAAGLGL